jgi:hypothetical protein
MECNFKGKVFRMGKSLKSREEEFILNNISVKDRLILAINGKAKLKEAVSGRINAIYLCQDEDGIFITYPQGYSRTLRRR